MTNIQKYSYKSIPIYSDDAEKLNEAAAKVGESVATVIEWLVEKTLDDLVKDVKGEAKNECRN